MSLLSAMYYDAVPENDGLKMGINIGFDKLRFLAPVRCNDNIRGVFQLSKTAEKDSNIMTLTWDTRIEIDGSSKPALLASWIERQYF
jgi:acyl dehydratase